MENDIFKKWNDIQNQFEASLNLLAVNCFDAIMTLLHSRESYREDYRHGDPVETSTYAQIYDLVIKSHLGTEKPSINGQWLHRTCFEEIFENKKLDSINGRLTVKAKTEIKRIFVLWKHICDAEYYSQDQIATFYEEARAIEPRHGSHHGVFDLEGKSKSKSKIEV